MYIYRYLPRFFCWMLVFLIIVGSIATLTLPSARQKFCDAEFMLLTPSLHPGWGGDGRELTYKQVLYTPSIFHIHIHFIFRILLGREDTRIPLLQMKNRKLWNIQLWVLEPSFRNSPVCLVMTTLPHICDISKLFRSIWR